MTLDNIDRTVQSKTRVNFRTLALGFPKPDVATFARSRSMKFALAVTLVVGVVMMVGSPLFLIYGGFLEAFGGGVLAWIIPSELIPMTAVILFVVAYFRARPLVFDRSQGSLWRRGKTDPVFGDYALLRDVEGLQICSKTVSGSEGGSWTALELNVVMKRPLRARVPVICHGNRAALFEDARKLAKFLNVPLVDHCDEPIQGKRLPLK